MGNYPSAIFHLPSAIASSRLLGHVGGICGGGNQAHRPLRDGRFPRVPLPCRQADAVQRGGGGSHIHKGGTCGDLHQQIGAGAGTGKDCDGGVGRGDGARAVDESDPRKLGRERGQRADGDGGG